MYAFYLCARVVVELANALLTHVSCKSEQKHAVNRVQLKAYAIWVLAIRPRNTISLWFKFKICQRSCRDQLTLQNSDVNLEGSPVLSGGLCHL